MNGNVKIQPTIKDVKIIGAPVVGGTLYGDFKDTSVAEDPVDPDKSFYTWRVGGAVESDKRTLYVKESYVGKQIVFQVKPVSQNSDHGIDYYSEPVFVEAGFQNISDEENENSFMKQQGNFSFYTPEPSDRIFVSTGGAFSLMDASTESIHVKGQNGYGLPVPENVKTYLINNPATTLFSTERDFGALVQITDSTNQLIVWGNNIPSSTDFTRFRNIKSVYANGSAFAFIYDKITSDNHWIGAIGNTSSGATIPDSIHTALVNDPPKAIYAAYEAFAVLTSTGKVYAWGKSSAGGTIDTNTAALLKSMKVTRIVAAMEAFCAIDEKGEIATWGSQNGGTIPSSTLETILVDGGVKSVIANRHAFVAITKNNAKAVAWGNSAQGGTINTTGAQSLAVRGNIVLCRAATFAFTIINAKGQAESWGVANSGGTIPGSRTETDDVVDMGPLLTSTVKSEIEQWFLKRLEKTGVDTRDEKSVDLAATVFARSQKRVLSYIVATDGKATVYGNDASFFMLAQDDEGITTGLWVWGSTTQGGAMSDSIKQTLAASLIQGVYCTNGAYGLVVTQGRTEGVVVVWGATLAAGDAGEIPTTPAEIPKLLSSGVVELYSIKRAPPSSPAGTKVDPSFAARHESGVYVLWGGNVTNQVFDPSQH